MNIGKAEYLVPLLASVTLIVATSTLILPKTPFAFSVVCLVFIVLEQLKKAKVAKEHQSSFLKFSSIALILSMAILLFRSLKANYF